jgi:RimJ/RimL family protein N-acetyltransferase
MTHPAPPPLPADVLARRGRLPAKPDPITLTGVNLQLRPLDLDRDIEALHAISSGPDCDEQIWRWMSGGPFADAAGLRAWLEPQDRAPDGRPFTVWAGGAPAGVVNLIANQPQHLKIELGSIWYGPAAQRTGVSRQATRLLLAHVFSLGYRRAEWKCDALNERSRRAALSYGFRFEGVQEAHYIIKGRNRDTAWYRILDDEWPRVRQTVAARAGAPTM